MWNPWKTLVLHNSRETLARLLNRRIRHLCTTYNIQNGYTFYPKYAMYVWFPVFLSRWSKMIGYDNLMCNVVWCYGTCLQASLLSFFLLRSLFFFFCMATLAQCTNQDSNCLYAGTNLWHKIGYQDMHHNDMVCMLWELWSLMCTSHVASNTQMASLDRQVMQNGLGVINAICKRNIQWCHRGYRPWRWWEAVLPMSTRS